MLFYNYDKSIQDMLVLQDSEVKKLHEHHYNIKQEGHNNKSKKNTCSLKAFRLSIYSIIHLTIHRAQIPQEKNLTSSSQFYKRTPLIIELNIQQKNALAYNHE